MAQPLDGKVAIVTGAGGGLGRAQAHALARLGAQVIAHDRDAEAVANTVAALLAEGASGEAAIGDIADTAAFRQAAADIERRHGRIDILVNNAGIGGGEPFEDVSEARFDEIFRTNVRAPFFAAQAVIGGMKARGWGRIVNISSLIALRGADGNPHYAGSKTALFGFTRSWAIEFAPYGITVNTVVPSFIETPMATAHFDDAEFARRAAANPAQRLATPEDVAGVVAYLAGPGAAFVNGQTISPNGGDFVGAM
ncbi:MAG: SDR family oxidoreductase [Alphaproteobacteria bacterium]|jgi:3-oxoacyl-[acyl-carrier protein] reductase